MSRARLTKSSRGVRGTYDMFFDQVNGDNIRYLYLAQHLRNLANLEPEPERLTSSRLGGSRCGVVDTTDRDVSMMSPGLPTVQARSLRAARHRQEVR